MADRRHADPRRVVEEVWNRGHLAVVDEMFAPDYREHNPRFGLPPGPKGYKQGVATLRGAFPNLHLDIADFVAAGDKMVASAGPKRFALQVRASIASDGNHVLNRAVTALYVPFGSGGGAALGDAQPADPTTTPATTPGDPRRRP